MVLTPNSQDVDGLNAYRDIAVHSPLYITSGKTLFYIFETLQDSKQVSIMTRSIRELKKIINVDPSTLGQVC
jgi:DeoR/GlpR family transcriptional regulator of sugar metabolism